MDTFQSLAGNAPASTLLLGAILVASLIGLFIAPGIVSRSLFRPFWFLPQRQYATLVTSAFLHADLAHLLFNAFTFWAFAFGLEAKMGTPRFVALYFIGMLGSDLGTWWRHRREPEYATLGASGAILAVLFASIVYTPTASIFVLPIPVPIPAPLFALGYLAYTIWASRNSRGRVNHDAHLSGAITGLLFVVLTDPGAVASAWRQIFG